MSLYETVRFCHLLSAACLFICMLEWLTAVRKPLGIRKSISSRLAFDHLPLSQKFLDEVQRRDKLILQSICIVGMLSALFIASSWLILPRSSGMLVAANAMALISIAFLTIRFPYGQDGADQMMFCLFGAATLSGLATDSVLGQELYLMFVTFQAALAYLTAGVAKMSTTTWRNGTGMMRIMSTKAYGQLALYAQLLRRPYIGKLMAWLVMIWEIAFPVALLQGGKFLILWLIVGVLFHLLNAAIMGLNTFFFAFVATYPACAYVSGLIKQAMVAN